MMRISVLAAAFTLLAAPSALAQSPSSTPNQSSAPHQLNTPQAQPQAQQSVRDQLHKNLEAAGFTDIKMMPSSFLVRAKDRDGNPVMMVINPDSVTAVVESPETKPSSTTGRASPNQNTAPRAR